MLRSATARTSALIALGIALLGAMSSAGCVRNERAAQGPCDQLAPHHVCSIPYELLYSDRAALLGKLVRIEGVLVVGVQAEPPGSTVPAMALFASAERAQACNLEHAVRIEVTSAQVAEQFAALDGWHVSMTGRLRPADAGGWLTLETDREPSLTTGTQLDLPYCLKPPPPPPPEAMRPLHH
jgi:hypothetical protein